MSLYDIRSKASLIAVLLLFFSLPLSAQDPARFKAKVDALLEKEFSADAEKESVIFTGSSSIVRWKEIESLFPKYDVLNYGFGGSHFSDLIHYYDQLIKGPSPDRLFIYEGDNDVASGKEPTLVFKQAKGLIQRIRRDLPETKIIIISPKPCIRNWAKAAQYIELNQRLETYCNNNDRLEFADVWKAMLDKEGIVFQDIFIEDGDHMNAKGYAIWKKVISDFLE